MSDPSLQSPSHEDRPNQAGDSRPIQVLAIPQPLVVAADLSEDHRRPAAAPLAIPRPRVVAADLLPPVVASPPGMPEIGSLLGRCVLTEVVGRGATGIVFRALHQSLGIPVAVKVLNRDALEDGGEGREQLRTEARALARLNHPHIVRVWDFEDQGPAPYLVMEYVEGWSLAELVQQSGRVRPDRTIRLLMQVAAGLEAAHALGIIHRDVKPANILIARDGTARLADLGLAMVVRPQVNGPGAAAVADDRPAGTAAYMAPEQALGSPHIDHRADIYALGATFYHVVTGQMPFAGRSRLEMMLKHMKEPLVPAHQLVPEVGPRLSEAIQRMMAKAPEDRPQTYADLLALLAASAEEVPGAPVGPLPAPSSGPRSFWQQVWSSFGRERGAGG